MSAQVVAARSLKDSKLRLRLPEAKVKVKVKCIYMGTYQLFPAPVLTQRPVSLFVMKPLPPYPPTPLLTHPLYILRATWFPIYPCCLRYARGYPVL